jgi:hypothetical protein
MHKAPKTLTILVLISIAILPMLYTTQANPTITLSLYKNNGYGMGQDMSGQWTLNTQTSTDTIHVEFYLDDQLQQTDNTAPFSWQFNTSNFTTGTHTLKAIAYNAAAENQTATLQRNFVEDNTSNILIIIIVVAVVVVALSVVWALYRIRKNKR